MIDTILIIVGPILLVILLVYGWNELVWHFHLRAKRKYHEKIERDARYQIDLEDEIKRRRRHNLSWLTVRFYMGKT